MKVCRAIILFSVTTLIGLSPPAFAQTVINDFHGIASELARYPIERHISDVEVRVLLDLRDNSRNEVIQSAGETLMEVNRMRVENLVATGRSPLLPSTPLASPTPIPEPGAAVLFALGALLLGCRFIRERR